MKIIFEIEIPESMTVAGVGVLERRVRQVALLHGANEADAVLPWQFRPTEPPPLEPATQAEPA